MKRPNQYSKPLGGVRTESYHPADVNTQYSKDLNTYIDFLEAQIKTLSPKPVLADSKSILNKITITATAKGATVQLDYKGKTYIKKCIPTPTGARYEGVGFLNESEIPEHIAGELEGSVAYNLMRCLERVK